MEILIIILVIRSEMRGTRCFRSYFTVFLSKVNSALSRGFMYTESHVNKRLKMEGSPSPPLKLVVGV